MTTTTARVAKIIECERQADQHAKAADELRWEAAELIASELADGKTQRQLAAEIGKTHNHARWMARAWQLFGDQVSRPPFSAAYAEAKKSEETRDAEQRERARLTAVSYRTVIFDPVALMAELFKGDGQDPATIAARMAEFPEYRSATHEQLFAVSRALTRLVEEELLS